VAIDGADEIDGAFRAIKGGGGALREKIVAAAARRDRRRRLERWSRRSVASLPISAPVRRRLRRAP
jgi:hypothetical protein